MLINNKNFTTIWFEDDKSSVQIIDQRFLPHELKIVTLTSLEDTEYAIREMQIRGAPLIGVTAAKYITKLITEKGNIDPNTNSISQLNIV